MIDQMIFESELDTKSVFPSKTLGRRFALKSALNIRGSAVSDIYLVNLCTYV